eukprot:TRINITY_DN260_c0_g1_i1.p1 TRINITY_DN260_c0_g1~~TRINITY_DN260_c0_g1_i1.p1  ORF type:complete len:349 (-),score=51.87 TRINITY_DN260_c0_g1_i1:368-1414(-)
MPYTLPAVPDTSTDPTHLACRSLYVGNLSGRVTEGLLFEIFSAIGPVTTCKIIKDRNGNSAGYGFVDYYDHDTANLALTYLNGRRIYDQEVKVNWAYAAGQKEDTTNHFHIFVGDLSPDIDDQGLFKAFGAFGSISDARVMWDQTTGKSRGYGFVAFKKKEDAEHAMTTMNGEWLGSRAIRCNWANQKMSASDNSPLDFESVISSTSSNNTTVYVGNLTSDVTEHLLRSIFLEYGYIEEIRIQTASEKTFAFVKYSSHDQAAKAIVGVNGKLIGTRLVKCSWGKEKGNTGISTPSLSGGIAQPPIAAPAAPAAPATGAYGYPQNYYYGGQYGYYGGQYPQGGGYYYSQ